jgi:hypothetical protein
MRPSDMRDVITAIDTAERDQRHWLLVDFLTAAWPSSIAQNCGPPQETTRDEERRDEERRR